MGTLVLLTFRALAQLRPFSDGYSAPRRCSWTRGGKLSVDAIQAGIASSADVAEVIVGSVEWATILSSTRLAAAATARRRRLAVLQRMHGDGQGDMEDSLLEGVVTVSHPGAIAVSLNSVEHALTEDDGLPEALRGWMPTPLLLPSTEAGSGVALIQLPAPLAAAPGRIAPLAIQVESRAGDFASAPTVVTAPRHWPLHRAELRRIAPEPSAE